ncbi:MAG: DUF2271 domain-containing protein [Bacillota bacterium]|nr:DUF2271 domain-containing protein [Bacillota bacterium]
MRVRVKRTILVLILPMVLALSACARAPAANRDKAAGPAGTPGPAVAANGKVTISYDLERVNRIASNQVAVWIEDANGNYVKTVYASAFMARGGYRSRPECCPEWVKVSGWKNAPASEVDAVTGPTQKPGRIVLTWDCTDRQGKRVPPGTYVCRLEGTIFWENRVLYKAEIQVGGARAQATPAPQYLPPTAKDIGEMVKNVSIEFTP